MFPNFNPQLGKITYIPRIFGFKIFGLVGSHYEYKYDEHGNCLNQKEIDKFLIKPRPKVKKKPKPDYERMIGEAEAEFEREYGEMLRNQMLPFAQ